MNIFKMIYSYFYYLFVKISYNLVEENEKERIYHKNNKYVITIRDAESGKRLYEVVKALNKSTFTYATYVEFKFLSYGISRKNSVKWICVEGGFSGVWEYYSHSKKLKIIQFFVESMQAKGFILDDTKFNNSTCDFASEFLSAFIQSNEEDKIERSKGCMIQYIHYVFSHGGNLKDFYENLSNKGLSEGYNIPYNHKIAQMCYDYFETGSTPDSIHDILTGANYAGRFENYSLVVVPDKLESKLKVIEKTEEHTIYDGNLKIYQNCSYDYQNFLNGEGIIDRSKKATLEQMEFIIVDIDNQVIGYKFAKEPTNMRMIFNPKNQAEIFSYVADLVRFLEKYNKSRGQGKDFEIEKALVCRGFSNKKYIFKCNTVKDLFNLTNNNWDNLKEQVTVIFFKLLADFMAKNYGELTSKEQFLEKTEVRYLNPIVVSEFVNFVLGKEVDYKLATIEFFKLLENRTFCRKSNYYYDTRFCYDPTTVHFVFDYEAEKKYNVKLEKGTTEKLPDERTVVIFKRSRKISAFKDKEKSMYDSALSAIKGEDEHVKLLGVSELIVDAQRLNSNNMYNIIGYVSQPLKGEQLTDEALLKLNNRDLLKVAAYLFSKFSNSYIPWNNIWMDKDFTFYINYMGENFQVEKSESGVNTAATFVQGVFKYLLSAGYNPNAFVGWKIPDGGFKVTKQNLLNLVDRFDMYCDEHKIYYDRNLKQCPVCAKTKYLVPKDYEQKFTKVFEDSVGVHYNIDQMYNLKIYKTPYDANVQANVMRIISLRLNNSEDVTLCGAFQDCFLPCKIALDSNNQFVGYLYGATKFEATNGNSSDVCVDLVDGKKLNNLPRLRSLIRLILQVKEMINHKHGFMANPFSHVFLNTSHKKQVQILNIEFAAPGNLTDLMKTKQWTSDYIYKVLESDSTIEFKRSILPEGLDTLLTRLTELSGQMTKKCSIHNIYYKRSYICCPKCVDPKDQPKSIMHISKSKYDGKTPVNEGGEAFIYSHSNKTVAKVFKEGEVNIDLKASVLFRIALRNDLLEKVNQEKHKFKFVVPKEILIDETTGEMFGYFMEWVKNAYPISALKDKVQIEKLGLSKEDIFEIIITMGEGIEALHKLNIYIGDLNGRNILFDAKKNVYFLDFDGMGVDEIAPEFCTDGYIDPLSKKKQNITMKDDWYSFAIQAFYYLTYTHPFNGIYTVNKNGRTIRLDIIEKMEKRISLLGNHGMKAPEIAEDWDWMDAELKNAFLNIFEGDNRESIVPYLKKQYQALSTSVNEKSFDKIYRINSKFIATEIDAFGGKVVRVITPFSAICENGNEQYIAILVKSNNEVKELKIKFQKAVQIVNDILLSDDGKIAFIVHNTDNITVIDLVQDKVLYYYDKVPGATNVVVNDRTIYFTGTYNEKNVIFKRTINPDGKVLNETIGFDSNRIKWFDVKFNTKFILIAQATQNSDQLYCNSQKFCAFEYTAAEIARRANYNVVYDEATKSWLVINNFGRGVVIHMSGESTEVDVSKYVNDVNFANIHFEKSNIYIPNQECMYIVNVSSKAVKKMECHKIMAPESKIFNVNSSGFSVITQNALYDVRKG